MAIEIVDLPINSMVIFHSYVNVYQRVNIQIAWYQNVCQLLAKNNKCESNQIDIPPLQS